MGMTSSQLDHLDVIAEALRAGDDSGVGVLSTGEKVYVALAADDADLLKRLGYTLVAAISRLGPHDILNLVERWQFRD